MVAPLSEIVTGFGGLDVSKDTERWKQRTGYMSQKFSLYLDLTVEENVRFFGTVYGLNLLTASLASGCVAGAAAAAWATRTTHSSG